MDGTVLFPLWWTLVYFSVTDRLLFFFSHIIKTVLSSKEMVGNTCGHCNLVLVCFCLILSNKTKNWCGKTVVTEDLGSSCVQMVFLSLFCWVCVYVVFLFSAHLTGLLPPLPVYHGKWRKHFPWQAGSASSTSCLSWFFSKESLSVH